VVPSEEILASISYHHMVGADHLTTSQLAEHNRRWACAACERPSDAGGVALARQGIAAIGDDWEPSRQATRWPSTG
jgi:hypothetical protein